jgi:tetratricopeptide (TPR) repeat protein
MAVSAAAMHEGLRRVPGFENLLSRAQALLPEGHPQRRTLRRTLAETFQVMGRHQDADTVLAQLLEATSPDEDAAGHHFLRLERARVRLAAGPDPVGLDDLRDQAARALSVFNAAGDEVGLAQAHFLLALIHLRLGQPTQTEKLARRALAHAERSGSAREQLGARWLVAMALEPGPRPVDDCIREGEQLRAWRGLEHPGLLAELARLRAMRGGFDEARDLVARARQLLAERFRARRPLGGIVMRAAEVELLAGDLASTETELRRALGHNLDMDERDPVSQTAAMLSRLLSIRGSTDEAASLATLSEHHAPSQSVVAQTLWPTARARVLVAGGAPGEAETIGREAIALAPSEMLNLGADLRVELSSTLTASGQHDQARTTLREAIDLYERKGNLANADRAAQLSHIATSRRKPG